MRQGGPHSTPIAGVDDAEDFRDTQQALSTVGIGIDKQWFVFRLLAALLHIGNIEITGMRNDSTIADQEPSLLLSTRFLGISPVEFKKWTIKKQITTRSEKIVTGLNLAQATVVRDSVAKFLYACLFEWLVAIVNESLAGENGEAASRAEMFIGVLDIYGFEFFKKNSFEQFCINYANEKLQQEFNAHVFKLEQEEYVREQIQWKFIDFSDNQPCIDVIEGKLGVLALLDEESRLPAGTDASFLQKLHSQLDKPQFKDVYKKPRFGTSAFTIAHYAVDVTYEAEGFLEKNRDTVPDEHLSLLASTKNVFLKEVLDAALAAAKPADPGSPGNFSDGSSQGSRRSSMIPDPGRSSLVSSSTTASGSGGGAKKLGAARKPTLGSIFKGSLISLMETLGVTDVHYIRCIKPNEAKRAWEFAPQQVLGQLRACGVLETIRISCAGYPNRWTFEEFAERYYMLLKSDLWQQGAQDPKAFSKMILGNTVKDEDKYQIGLTKIFLRAGMLAYLESRRLDRLNSLATLIQKNFKRTVERRRYLKMRQAAIRLQTWWRGVLARKQELQGKVEQLEQQMRNWVTKFEDSDAKAKQLQTDIQTSYVPLTRFEELMTAKADLDARMEAAVKKAKEQEQAITSLTTDIEKKTKELEAKSKVTNGVTTSKEDASIIATLKNEISSMREQLNRSNALNSLTGRAYQPTSPTFAPNLKGVDKNTAPQLGPVPIGKRRQRRHSTAGVFADRDEMENDSDEDMYNAKKLRDPRAVSMAFPQDGIPRFRPTNGLPDIYDDPAEEKIRLLEDVEALDEEMLQVLIKGLKTPPPNLTNQPSMKEVLFPANLISLVTNEMWKYGLIAESERFLANVMQTIQSHVMSFSGEDAIVPGIFWLSNVHEILSFICLAESDMLQGIGPGGDPAGREFDWSDYERLVSIVKHDLDSLEYNIYHTWMLETKKKLAKMVIPALIESQSLPGFTTTDGGGRLFNRLLNSNTQPAFSMDDVLNLLNKVWRSLKSYYMEESVVQQVITELLKLVGVTSFNDLLMRRNFCSWKRAMQIQYNITRIEEWCKSHGMPEGTLQLEHLMQATKLLQLKKATAADIEIIYDVCWMLSPSQIQRMCTNYFVADYENPISPEILRVVASRVNPNDRNDHLLLPPESEDVGPYESPLPRDVSGLETYVPAYLNMSHIRRLAMLVA
ncbi:Myosin type-2 heavy chain 1 [Serendipita sp. 397]|nr:Myosin type-2 heavy chain 1 [Serendipita sp. 397]